jgi:hypothetical protein
MRRDPDPGLTAPRTDGERYWRRAFYLFSAALAASALVELTALRYAGALADVGMTCLMVSLIPQFPFVRAIVSSRRHRQSQEELLRDLERVRTNSPWAETASAAGWLLLGASVALRAFGLA